MLLLTNEVQEVQMFFVLVQYVINQLLLVPAHHIIILTAFFEIYLSAIYLIMNQGATDLANTVQQDVALALFNFLEHFPFSS
ncbi:hypothetical protein ACYCJ6_26960, partial [Klebsiella pneumoniae]